MFNDNYITSNELTDDQTQSRLLATRTETEGGKDE
jgi:hypothetical protein